MGQYAMTASQGVKSFLPDGGPVFTEDGGLVECELVEVTGDSFSFDAILSHESTSQRAWVTLNTYSREGTFDGQVLTSTAEANRVFAACAPCSTRLVETISVAVLSRSQAEAALGQCPEQALDGGVIVDADAGLVAPGDTPLGYDGVRLCGELTTRVVALGTVDGGPCDPICDGCSVHYQLRGDRR